MVMKQNLQTYLLLSLPSMQPVLRVPDNQQLSSVMEKKREICVPWT